MLKICSIVLLYGRKPACSSDCSSSALPLSRLSMILSIILPGWLSRLMVLKFSQQRKFSFFGIAIMNDFVHSSCQILVSQICWHMIMYASTIASPPCLISSVGTLSTPKDVCVFSIRIASSTSARRMSVSAFSF